MASFLRSPFHHTHEGIIKTLITHSMPRLILKKLKYAPRDQVIWCCTRAWINLKSGTAQESDIFRDLIRYPLIWSPPIKSFEDNSGCVKKKIAVALAMSVAGDVAQLRQPQPNTPPFPRFGHSSMRAIYLHRPSTQSIATMSEASGEQKERFAPKVAVELAPPKDDVITRDYLAKCDGEPLHSIPLSLFPYSTVVYRHE